MFQIKVSRDKVQFLLLLFSSLCLLLTFACVQEKASHLPSDSSKFDELWKKSGIRTKFVYGPQERQIFMEIRNDDLVYINSGRPYKLKSIDILTGNVNWERTLTKLPDAAIINSNTVFLGGLLGPQHRSTDVTCDSVTWDRECDAVFISAHDIETGELRWSNVYSGMALISQMITDENGLFVNGAGTKGAYYSSFVINPIQENSWIIRFLKIELRASPLI